MHGNNITSAKLGDVGVGGGGEGLNQLVGHFVISLPKIDEYCFTAVCSDASADYITDSAGGKILWGEFNGFGQRMGNG
jgi:hypothetical protein